MEVNEKDYTAKASGVNAVNNLTRLSIERMREKEKSKRLLMIIVFLLMVLAIVVLVFSPPDKESISYIVGAVLLVLALGIIGASKFVFNLFGIKVDTTGEK